MRESWDILISGGGIAGLAAAAAFGSAGFCTLVVDPAPPVTDAAADGADLRTTAILTPSTAVLQAAGLWERLAPFAAPLQVMRIVDAGGTDGQARTVRDFDAADLSDAPFGWNLPNWLLRREMAARLAELPNVAFRTGLATRQVMTREGEALVTLSDGSLHAARLLVAADGRDSPVRRALGIPVTTFRYGQKALSFAVTHPIPHENVSTEVHRSGGPFTLVPLPDRDGRPASAVVWMERGAEAARLASLAVPDFEAAMNDRSAHVLGPLTLATPRQVWPIIGQVAARMSGERTALMAEAAHVVPPIGAQGLNMSLADLGLLVSLTTADPGAIGAPAMLDRYHRRRHPEVLARVTGVDLLNRASMAGAQPLRDLRMTALNALYGVPLVRKTLMRAGMGVS